MFNLDDSMRVTVPFSIIKHAPIYLCLCVFVFFRFILHSCCIIVSGGGVDLMGLKPNPLDLSSFSALTLLVGSFDP